MVVPSFATDYQSPYRFGNWAYTFLKDYSGWTPNARGWGQGVCPVSEDTMHHCSTYTDIDEDGLLFHPDAVFVATCDYCGNEFHGTATEVEKVYDEITPDYTIDDEGNVSNLVEWECKHNYNGFSSSIEMIGASFLDLTVTGTNTTYPSYYLYGHFTAPQNTDVYLTGKFQYSDDNFVNVTGCRNNVWLLYLANDGSWKKVNDTDNLVKISDETSDIPTYKFNTGNYTEFRIQSTNQSVAKSQTHLRQYQVPTARYYDTETSLDNTPISGGGNITYTDVNGDEIIAENVFFDQSTNNFYNPATDTTIPVDGWEYDYSTRTYTGHTENGDVLITYGDENITVVEGGNTYNYYYGNGNASNGGSGSGSDGNNSDSGTGIWQKLGKLLGTLLGGLIDLITGVIDGLLDSLISLVKTTLEKLGEVVNLFGSFGDALRSLWAWLPDEIITILTAGVSVVVFASVLKLFI